MFNYCGNKRIADMTFALFTLIWIPTRHALFAIPFYSLTFEAPYLITVRPHADAAMHVRCACVLL
jgi:hypothetical protein